MFTTSQRTSLRDKTIPRNKRKTSRVLCSATFQLSFIWGESSTYSWIAVLCICVKHAKSTWGISIPTLQRHHFHRGLAKISARELSHHETKKETHPPPLYSALGSSAAGASALGSSGAASPAAAGASASEEVQRVYKTVSVFQPKPASSGGLTRLSRRSCMMRVESL